MGASLDKSYYSREGQGEAYDDLRKFSPIDPNICPRFRSWEVSLEKPILAIRGRCGWGNRDEYQQEIDEMEEHQAFISSEEMEDDPTYMIFYYRLPREEWEDFVVKYASKAEAADE